MERNIIFKRSLFGPFLKVTRFVGAYGPLNFLLVWVHILATVIFLVLLLRYDIGSAISDNTGRGNEDAGWFGQSEAVTSSGWTNERAGEVMTRLPLCYEPSDIEPMSTTTAK